MPQASILASDPSTSSTSGAETSCCVFLKVRVWVPLLVWQVDVFRVFSVRRVWGRVGFAVFGGVRFEAFGFRVPQHLRRRVGVGVEVEGLGFRVQV